MLKKIFTAILFMSITGMLSAQCVSAPGSGDITGNVSFGDPINWANPNRVEASDELYARARLNAGDTTKYLWVSDFDFAIPAAATIDGIEVIVEGRMDAGADVQDASIRLIKGNVITGDDRAGMGAWTNSDQVSIYGGNADLWGEAWSPIDIMDEGFGVVISVTRGSGPNNLEALIDYVGIVVYYNDPGTGCILPVQLGAFSAQEVEGDVRLDWVTLSETENDRFVVERSTDAVNFDEIGSVDGMGGGFEATPYTYTDRFAPAGNVFYRLRQVDIDGGSAYSEVLSVQIGDLSGLEVTAFPVPASDVLNVSVAEAGGELELSLMDMNGRVVLQKTLPVGGLHSLDVGNMPRGMYLLRVSDSFGQHKSRKVVLK